MHGANNDPTVQRNEFFNLDDPSTVNEIEEEMLKIALKALSNSDASDSSRSLSLLSIPSEAEIDYQLSLMDLENPTLPLPPLSDLEEIDDQIKEEEETDRRLMQLDLEDPRFPSFTKDEPILSKEWVDDQFPEDSDSSQSLPPLPPFPFSKVQSNPLGNDLSREIKNKSVESKLKLVGRHASPATSRSRVTIGIKHTNPKTEPVSRAFSTVVKKESQDEVQEDVRMNFIYLLKDAAENIGLTVDKSGNIKMIAYEGSPDKVQQEHFKKLISIIAETARKSKSTTCKVFSQSVVTYSELLHRLASCKWGRGIIKQYPDLSRLLEEERQVLVRREFGIQQNLWNWITEEQGQWKKGEKDVRETFSHYEVLYHAESDKIYIRDSKNEGQVLNYTKMQILDEKGDESDHIKKLFADKQILVKGEIPSESSTEPKQRSTLLKSPKGLEEKGLPESRAESKRNILSESDTGKKLKKNILSKSRRVLPEKRVFSKSHEEPHELELKKCFKALDDQRGTTGFKLEALGSDGAIHEKFSKLKKEEKFEILKALLVDLERIHKAGIIHHGIDINHILIGKDPTTKKWQARISISRSEKVELASEITKKIVEEQKNKGKKISDYQIGMRKGEIFEENAREDVKALGQLFSLLFDLDSIKKSSDTSEMAVSTLIATMHTPQCPSSKELADLAREIFDNN